MFAFPDAKRVRREELDTSSVASSEHESDDGLRTLLNDRIGQYLTLNLSPALNPRPQNDKDTADPADHVDPEFSFRLFSHSVAPKVILHTARKGPGGIVSRRPLSHYIATPAAGTLKAEFEYAALTGDDVLQRSRERWPGREMTWRVREAVRVEKKKAEASGSEKGEADGHRGDVAEQMVVVVQDDQRKRRKRPGKKLRLVTREKHRVRVAQAKARAEAEKAKLEKEDKAREKRKRLNGLKKQRKRTKKKQAADDQKDEGETEQITN